MQINKTHIEQALLKGNLEGVIEMMLAILKANDSDDYNDIVLQSASYNSLLSSIRNGTISNNNAEMTKARIRHAVQHYLGKLKPNWTVEFDCDIEEPIKPTTTVAKGIATSSVKTILFLSANPMNTSRLFIDKEIREIKEAIKISKNRDNFNIEQVEAVGVQEFRRAITDYAPSIIHFSGHGSPAGKIILQGKHDAAEEIDEKALGNFFQAMIEYGDIPLECVFLNACYSKVQAEEIVQSVPYVIGMRNSVEDTTAIAFATAFYETLASGKDYKAAYELGRVNISLEGCKGDDLPVLLVK